MAGELSVAFRNWRIDTKVSAIRRPLLAVQGLDDEYDTLPQFDGIAATFHDADAGTIRLPPRASAGPTTRVVQRRH
jgi:fermentation-respiration switch protein FrsA (DUF1100 family)